MVSVGNRTRINVHAVDHNNVIPPSACLGDGPCSCRAEGAIEEANIHERESSEAAHQIRYLSEFS